MSPEVKAILQASIVGIVTGGATAFVSVKLALRRFRSERWWERKVQAYSDLFAALFHVQRHTDYSLKRLEHAAHYSEDFLKELGDTAGKAYTEIRKMSAMAPFLFSQDTAACLAKLEEAFDDPHHNCDYHEELESDLAAVTRTLADLRPLAKRDLDLK